jgi:TP901 family phage tail tape measure protein
MARRRIELEIVGDASQLGREFSRAARQAQLFNARITGATRGLSRGLGFAGATAGIASLGLAIRSTVDAAVSFESSFAGVRKTVDATEPQFRELAEGFRAMSREIPVSVDELNRIGESAGQLGIRREAILDFTRTVADLGVTTDLASDQAADSLARLANIAGTPQDAFDRLGSTLVDLGNKLAATESEILDFGLRIAGAGRQVGLTEANILAIAGAFESVGVEAERGGTAVSKVLLQMNTAVLEGGDLLRGFADVAGVSAEEFRAAFQQDAGAAFVRFVEGLDEVRRSGGNTAKVLRDLELRDSRLIAAFQAMAAGSTVLSRALAVGDRAWQRNNALTSEAEKRYATTASRLQVFRNRVNDLQITLGNALIPALEDVVTPLSEWLQSTENQEEVTRRLTAVLDSSRQAIQGIADVAIPLGQGVNQAADAVGGLRNAVQLLLITMATAKVVGFTAAITGLGRTAATTTTTLRALRLALLRLGAIGVITLGVELILNRDAIESWGADVNRQVEDFFGLSPPKIPVEPEARLESLQNLRDRLLEFVGPASDEIKSLDRAIEALLRRIERAKGSVRPDDRGGARGPGAIAASNRAVDRRGADAANEAADEQTRVASEVESAADRAAEAKERAADAFQTLLEGFELRAERSQSIEGDIRIREQELAAIRRRMQVAGRTVDLLREELRVEQEIAALKQQQAERRRDERRADQFEALGLTREGQERTPSAGALLRRARTLQDELKGTPLDTADNRAQLARIVSVLRKNFKTAGRDVRQAILDMLNEISGGLDQGTRSGPLTKTTGLNTKKILTGLGLSADEINALRGRLSSFNSAGVAPAAALSLPSGNLPTGGFVGGPIVVESHTTVEVDGVKLAQVVTKQQQKTARRNPKQKRGPNRRGGV